MSGTVLKLTVAGASKQLWFFFTRQDAASAAGAAETAHIAKQRPIDPQTLICAYRSTPKFSNIA